MWLNGSWHCSSNHNVGAEPNSVGVNTLAAGQVWPTVEGVVSFTLLVGEVVGLARPPLTGIRRHTFEAPGHTRDAGHLMKFLGAVNARWGRGTLKIASAQARMPRHD